MSTLLLERLLEGLKNEEDLHVFSMNVPEEEMGVE